MIALIQPALYPPPHALGALSHGDTVRFVLTFESPFGGKARHADPMNLLWSVLTADVSLFIYRSILQNSCMFCFRG